MSIPKFGPPPVGQSFIIKQGDRFILSQTGVSWLSQLYQYLLSNGLQVDQIQTSQSASSTSSTPLVASTLYNVDSFMYADTTGFLRSTEQITDGQLLIGRTGNIPLPNTLSGDNGITIENSAATINVSGVNALFWATFW